MLETIGKAFPASWGYRLMTGGTFGLENLLPMLVIFVLAVCVCHIAIRKDDLAQQIERLSSHINLFQKYLKESGRRKLH